MRRALSFFALPVVVVVGLGGVGLASVLGALACGAAPVVAVDLSEDKLALARTLGAVETVNAADPDAVEQVRALTNGGADFAFEMAVTANDKSGIKSFDDMKGKVVGATAGTYEAIALEAQVKEWGSGEFRPYQTQADVFLAVSQGQLDATVSTSTVAQANVKTGNFPGISVVGKAPFDTDYVALFTNREEAGFINYLNLFINQQVRTGRYSELYETWVGGEAPSLTVPNVYR